jgi:FtsH-binding integral membrane protein
VALRLDQRALVTGALAGTVIVLPAAIATSVAADAPSWLALVTLLGLTLAAVTAAVRQTTGTPLAHGMLAALGVFVVVQGIGILLRAARGDELNWGRYFGTAVVTLLVGCIGGVAGGIVTTRRRAS